MKLYHATPTVLVNRILLEGLTLPIGRRTSGSRGDPRLYLFKDKRKAQLYFPALYYTGSLPRPIPYSVLEVTLPRSTRTYGDVESSSSFFVKQNIPPRYIRVVSSHNADYSEFENINWDEDL